MESWKLELEKVLKLIPGYDPWAHAEAIGAWLDHEGAIRAINFFADRLKHVEGIARGTEFLLRPWQAAAIGNLFGWKVRDEAGRIVRRYRQSLWYIPRGNGKTPLAAGVIVYVFFEDGYTNAAGEWEHEAGMQNYLAAGQKEQAGFLFRNALGMVEQDPDLHNAVTIFKGDQHRCMILKEDPLSFFKTIPADAAGQHGGIPHVIVVDELHVQENRDLLDVFETGMVKKVRTQPLLLSITTADYERESICNEVYALACRVRDNGGDPEKPGFDPRFLPIIYEAGQEDDWTQESTWRKANPNLGVSVELSAIAALCKKAQEIPAFENTFRRLHLNQRTKQEMRLISTQAWDACQPPEGLTPKDLIGKDCYPGVDLASTDDLASASFTFALPDDWLAILVFSWCPEERIKRRANQKYPYDVWSQRGYGVPGWPNFLNATPGDTIDYNVVQRDILMLRDCFNVVDAGFDPHGASQIMQNLMAEGLNIFAVTQSFRNLSGPTKDLVRRVKTKKIAHFNNPVLKWAVSNAAAHFDGTIPQGSKLEDHLDKIPIMLSKRKSADKIDPLAATVLGLARMGEHPADAGDMPGLFCI